MLCEMFGIIQCGHLVLEPESKLVSVSESSNVNEPLLLSI